MFYVNIPCDMYLNAIWYSNEKILQAAKLCGREFWRRLPETSLRTKLLGKVNVENMFFTEIKWYVEK